MFESGIDNSDCDWGNGKEEFPNRGCRCLEKPGLTKSRGIPGILKNLPCVALVDVTERTAKPLFSSVPPNKSTVVTLSSAILQKGYRKAHHE